MTGERLPMDLKAYEARARSGVCFACAFVSGDPEFHHETVHEDDEHIAFLDRARLRRACAVRFGGR
ncbi:hypothetical protein [Streptomyces sp. HNM0575]|uniref:hypothetical protein n=1 Tax=Streptomyces sp. HNM0575 TaxID=2716338 RepID=UPI001F0F7C04|nr:hypothetical protein [Streptomyces sp. HNM0575]